VHAAAAQQNRSLLAGATGWLTAGAAAHAYLGGASVLTWKHPDWLAGYSGGTPRGPVVRILDRPMR
jgi:hypothetical protein